MKVYAATVLDSVAECLRTFYHYKKDLRGFLLRVGIPSNVVSMLPWSEYKRTIANELINRLASDPGGTKLIDSVIDGLVEQDERFPNLRRLEDGPRLVKDAQAALQQLKNVVDRSTLTERADRARAAKRTDAERAAEALRERKASIASLGSRFKALCVATDPRKRGYDFQDLLRDLFLLHDLEPRGAFARPGEQTDGSIRLDGTVLLVEARWTMELTEPGEVREFRTKVHDKLDNTLGLMISMAGFTPDAVNTAQGGGRLLTILMDGLDVARIYDGIDDVVEVLRRKLRRAAEEGRALWHYWE